MTSAEYVPSRIPSSHPLHEPWDLTEAERERFRVIARASREAKVAASRGETEPLHEINVPRFDPLTLMPQLSSNGLRALSLFSGGGGLDLGFERAGYEHAASFEIMEDAAATLVKARPAWEVFGGSAGDVRGVDWRKWRTDVDILHGGPPCQPFSNAGRQRGAADPRDMWPEFVRAVKGVKPAAFVGENVPALASKTFSSYVRETIVEPLEGEYRVHALVLLRAQDFGIPQVRRRVFFIGFRSSKASERWRRPEPTHAWRAAGAGLQVNSILPETMGMREALGLPDIGYDDLSPTIRSTLNGPRNTTSILNSVSARSRFEKLEVWPNGVAPTRGAARAFVAKNGHFRLSTADVSLLQGFPDNWPFQGATYMVLGQIGNAVPPPLGYVVAVSVSDALRAR